MKATFYKDQTTGQEGCVNIPEGFRLLDPREKVKKGDFYLWRTEWSPYPIDEGKEEKQFTISIRKVV